MTREERKRTIAQRCKDNLCDEKAQERHFRLYVDEGWNPHPSPEFEAWWHKHPDFKEAPTITALTACNVRRYMQEFINDREVGLA